MSVVRTILLLSAGAALARRGRARGAPPRPEAPAASPGRKGLKRWAIRGTGLLAALAAGGFLVAASGIVPIKASSGHWPITAWFLNFSMERSVSTHTLGGTTPPLDDPALVLRGAGHYETGCRPCHGSPGLPDPRIARRMTPPPPYLPPVVSGWEPDELFYVVKHGVKFTGMPAWPTPLRDDEVWAMVAFLLAMPGMETAEYRRLVHGESPSTGEAAPMHALLGPEEAPRAVSESCARCHGADGLGRGPAAFPRLAGQSPQYLYGTLMAYARGERHSGLMEPVAAGLAPDEIRDLARYYARLRPPQGSPAEDAAAVARGAEIARLGVPGQRVPSCADCHGPGTTRRNPAYPVLAGQYAEYLVLQLELFKEGRRGGSPYARLMHKVVPRLTREQMRDVARYYASLGPDAGLQPRPPNPAP